MRDKKTRGKSGYVSRHAAPEKPRGRQSYQEDYYEDEQWQYEEELPAAPPSRKELRAQRAELRRQKRRRFFRRLKIAVTVIFVLAILLAGAATVGGYYVSHLETSFPNTFIDGIFVGDMTRDQVAAALSQRNWDENNAIPLTVTLFDAAEFDVDRCLAGAKMNSAQAVDAVMAFGHGTNWYKNLFDYARCYIKATDIAMAEQKQDRVYVLAQIESGLEALDIALGDGSYEIDEINSVLRVVKGAGQIKIDTEALTDAIYAAMDQDMKNLSWTEISSQPQMPDYQAIFDDHSAEPVDAYFTDDNTFTVVDHIVGCDFDVEQAKQLWLQAAWGQKVEVPLEIIYPQVTGDYLRSLLYRDRLCGSITYYTNSTDNRVNNVNLAAEAINGIILYPGDVFSYNGVVGQRTEAAGYLPAGAYENGEVIEEIGGGICQVSSTLYSAMLYGYGLNTVERYPHYFPVDYLEKGYDATVSWPNPDFKFRNDRAFPVKIVAKCDNDARSLTVEIWGTDMDGYYIQLTKDTYRYNNARYPWISEGHGVQVHRYIFDANGMQVDQISEIYDIYHDHDATDQIKALDAQAAAQAQAAANAALGIA